MTTTNIGGTEVPADAVAEAIAVGGELEALLPTIMGLLERGREALSAIDFARDEDAREDRETDEEFEEFQKRSGYRKVWEVAANLHNATEDCWHHNDEMIAAKEMRSFAARIACHGDTECCAMADACSKYQDD